MIHLYFKVFVIIVIAYHFAHPTLTHYLEVNIFGAGIILLLALLYLAWIKIRKNKPGYVIDYKLTRILTYTIIFSLLIVVVSFRFEMTRGINPLQYWDEIGISTGKNRQQVFIARVKSMDGFKKESYRVSIELLSSHAYKKSIPYLPQRVEKSYLSNSKTNSGESNSQTNLYSMVIDYLSQSNSQRLGIYPQPITIYLYSYLQIIDLNANDIILIRPYYIRKTEDIKDASSYRNYLIANGVYANGYYNPRDLLIIKHNEPPLIIGVWNKIKSIINQYIESPSAGLAYAMFTGNKEEMPNYIKEYFRSTGTYHVLAVSGMHAGLLSIFFFYIFRILGMRKKTCLALIFFTVLPLYLFITDFQISIQRTYLMGLIGFLLLYFDRSVNLMSILCLSFIAIALYNPSIVYSVSFQLSFSAVFGIAHAIRLIGVFRSKNAFINGLWVSVGAQLGTLPIVIYYFGYNNFLTLLYNVVVSVLISTYYLYTLLFLLLGIPLSYLSSLASVANLISSTLGSFLTYLGNILFLFLHYTSVEFDWFYFPFLKNKLGYAMVMGFLLFVGAEVIYQLRSRYLRKYVHGKTKEPSEEERGRGG